MTTTKRIAVQKKVLTRNDEIAARVRERFLERGIFAVNILGSPGSGKTSLVELTAGRVRAAALSGDQATENDAKPKRLDEGVPGTSAAPTLIGSSASMLKVFKNIAYVAPSKTTVLIQGESGTGKELVARAIHENSPRRKKAFIAVNCGALAETLLESELFGHVRGAFTGAMSDKKGLFEIADGGTLFLDEISETSQALQVKLLRVLQESEFKPVGGARSIHADVRVIAATNHNLEELVKKGEFREDLLYRLNVVTIDVPSLRERPEDIPKLASYFLKRLAADGQPVPEFTARALDALVHYRWPGNARELENTIERLALFYRGRQITVEDLPEKFQERQSLTPGGIFSGLPSLDEVERRYLLHVLEHTRGNRKRAAEILGIDRRTLYRMLERYGLGTRRRNPAGPVEGPPGGTDLA